MERRKKDHKEDCAENESTVYGRPQIMELTQSKEINLKISKKREKLKELVSAAIKPKWLIKLKKIFLNSID